MDYFCTLPEDDKIGRYRMAASECCHKMIDIDMDVDQHATAALLHNTTGRNGEVIQRLAIEVDGKIYATISPSFIRGFETFAEFIGGAFTFRAHLVETKAGRKCLIFEGVSTDE